MREKEEHVGAAREELAELVGVIENVTRYAGLSSSTDDYWEACVKTCVAKFVVLR